METLTRTRSKRNNEIKTLGTTLQSSRLEMDGVPAAVKACVSRLTNIGATQAVPAFVKFVSAAHGDASSLPDEVKDAEADAVVYRAKMEVPPASAPPTCVYGPRRSCRGDTALTSTLPFPADVRVVPPGRGSAGTGGFTDLRRLPPPPH